jgi:hypothetical protein
MIVVGALVTVIAGAYFATRYFSGTKPSSVIPPATVVTQGNPLSAAATQSLSATQPATITITEAATNVTPFLTIDGFPADVPILTDNQGDLTVTTTNATSTDTPTMKGYSFSTKMTFQQVSDFYKAGMGKNGWKLISTTTGNNMVSFVFSKGDTRMVELSIITIPAKQVQQIQMWIQ